MSIPESVNLQRLADAVARLVQPVIPLRVDLWGPGEVAAYLKVGRRQVAERYANEPGFPRKIRLPAEKGPGLMRWKAAEVIAWAESRKEKQ